MLSYIQQHYNVPKLIVGDFNFSNIRWYDTYDFGANAICSNLTDNELRFVNALRGIFLFQHASQPTRQRGSDPPHTLDLIITSDNFLSDIEYLSPLGMSDHSVLKFNLHLLIDRVPTKDKFRCDKGDYSKLCALLDINWDDILDIGYLVPRLTKCGKNLSVLFWMVCRHLYQRAPNTPGITRKIINPLVLS